MIGEDPRLSHPDTKAGRLQRAALLVLAEHQADGSLPTSGRFLFYELEQRGVFAKNYYDVAGRKRPRTPAQDFADALTHLREQGVIPWEWLVDETRAAHKWQYAATVADYLAEQVDRARIDPWAGEPPPLLLVESRSLAGVLRTLAYNYVTPVAATNGQVGGFLHTDVAPLLSDGQRVLYLGDFDWQGGQIEANTRKVLGWYARLEWERLALTAEQVNTYGLQPISKTDRRYRPPRVHQAVETEALRQGVIVTIARDRLDALLPEPLDDVLVRERAERAAARQQLSDGR